MLLSITIDFLNNHILLINFICHLVIFLGGFYIALHSRILPIWATTSLWYIGVSSLLASITIILEWVKGPMFAFSYTSMGKTVETLLHINAAIMVFMLFFNTIRKDYKNIKSRQHNIINKI